MLGKNIETGNLWSVKIRGSDGSFRFLEVRPGVQQSGGAKCVALFSNEKIPADVARELKIAPDDVRIAEIQFFSGVADFLEAAKDEGFTGYAVNPHPEQEYEWARVVPNWNGE